MFLTAVGFLAIITSYRAKLEHSAVNVFNEIDQTTPAIIYNENY